MDLKKKKGRKNKLLESMNVQNLDGAWAEYSK